jgi:methanethiol S-methyltransferase
MMADKYAYGMWVVVFFNVALFLFFIGSFLVPRARVEWRNLGVVTGFLVALFTEMYGFPLTIYLLTGWLGEAYPVLEPFTHKHGHLWVVLFGGSDIAWALVMILSLLFLFAGYMLLSKGWRQIHGAHGGLVTGGVYAYVRHPQYTGLFLFILGFLIQWPTLLTVLMTPILLYAYVRLARREERMMHDRFGAAYMQYVNRTPMFFPPPDKWKAFLTASGSEVIDH